MGRERSSIFIGTLILTGSGLFCQVLGFFYRIMLSRLIGAEVMGLYQLILPVYSTLSSLTLVGLTVSMATLSAELNAESGLSRLRQLRAMCLKLFLMMIVPLGILTALFSDPISVHLLGDARTRLGLVLLLPCLLLTGVENLQKHAFFGIGMVRPPALTEMAEQVIRSAAVLGLLLVFLPQNPERTVGLIVTGMIICEIFSATALTFLFRKYIRAGQGAPVPPGTLRRRIGAIAVPVTVTSLLGSLMGSANAVLLPQRLVAGGATIAEAMRAFGVLSGMTLPLLSLPLAFVGAMCLILAPRLAEGLVRGARAEMNRQMTRVLLSTSLIIMPAMALLTVVGPTIGALLFREPSVGYLLPVLAVGTLLSCYQSVLSSALNGIGKQRAAAFNAIASGALQLVCTVCLVGIPGVGLRGFAAGFVLSSAAGMLLNWRAVQRATGLRVHAFAWLVSPLLAALLAGLTANLLFMVLQTAALGPLPTGLATLAFGVLVYLCALAAQGVHWSDIS